MHIRVHVLGYTLYPSSDIAWPIDPLDPATPEPEHCCALPRWVEYPGGRMKSCSPNIKNIKGNKR